MRSPSNAFHKKIQLVISEVVGKVTGVWLLDDLENSLLLQVNVLPDWHFSAVPRPSLDASPTQTASQERIAEFKPLKGP